MHGKKNDRGGGAPMGLGLSYPFSILSDINEIIFRSCNGSVDKTVDAKSWDPRFKSSCCGSSALREDIKKLS